MSFIPAGPKERRKMLDRIGVAAFEDLVAHVPPSLRFDKALDIPDGLSEYEIMNLMGKIAADNDPAGGGVSFLGAGIYDHIVPAAVNHMLLRSEFYTAYTPYQPEVSQGTLTAIFEFQTMICKLTGMEVANASMYDGASATAEAVLMAASSLRKRRVIRLSPLLHPHYIQVVATYCRSTDLELRYFEEENGRIIQPDPDLCCDDICWVVQTPNFFGLLEDLGTLVTACHGADALFIAAVNPVSLGILEPPGGFGADIVIGEGQPLGSPTSFGGPGFGFLACSDRLKRLMPGRLVGRTVDRDGRTGFVLTLQTREQHIRRERATSNICTNQALCALACTITLSLFGKDGFADLSRSCFNKAHYLKKGILGIQGFEDPAPGLFFNEFTVKCPCPPETIFKAGAALGIFPGVPLGRFRHEWRDLLLVAVTEKRTRKEMDDYLDFLRGFAV